MIGIGFFLEGTDSTARFKHSGWNEGFISEFRGYRNNGKGVVIMINSNEGVAIINEIMNSVAEVYEWPDYLPKKTDFSNLNESNIKKLIGVYGDNEIELYNSNNRLYLIYQNQEPLELRKTSNGFYKNEYLNLEIAFKDNDLDLTQEGQTKTYKKE